MTETKLVTIDTTVALDQPTDIAGLSGLSGWFFEGRSPGVVNTPGESHATQTFLIPPGDHYYWTSVRIFDGYYPGVGTQSWHPATNRFDIRVSFSPVSPCIEWKNSGQSGAFGSGSNWVGDAPPGIKDCASLANTNDTRLTTISVAYSAAGNPEIKGLEIEAGNWELDLTELRVAPDSQTQKLVINDSITINAGTELILRSTSPRNTAVSAPDPQVVTTPHLVLEHGAVLGFRGAGIETDRLEFAGKPILNVELYPEAKNTDTPLLIVGPQTFSSVTLNVRLAAEYPPKSLQPGDRFRLVQFNKPLDTTSIEDIYREYVFQNYQSWFSPDLYWGVAFRAASPSEQYLELIVLKVPRLDGISGPLLQSNRTENLVLVTHGTASSIGSAEDGRFGEIAARISAFLSSHNPQWRVAVLDWSEPEYATTLLTFNPATTAQYCLGIGQSFAHWLDEQSIHYRQVHLMGHSSGAWLVNQLARRLPATTAVQLTFWDAFNILGTSVWPLGNYFQDFLGLRSGVVVQPRLNPNDFAEHYVHRTPPQFAPRGTNDKLPFAFNVDVSLASTPLYAKCRTPFESGPIILDLVDGHAWPYKWYLETVKAANEGKWLYTDPVSSFGFYQSPAFQSSGFSPRPPDLRQALSFGGLARLYTTCTSNFIPTDHCDFEANTDFEKLSELAGVKFEGAGSYEYKDDILLIRKISTGALLPQTVLRAAPNFAQVSTTIEPTGPLLQLRFEYGFPQGTNAILKVLLDGALLTSISQQADNADWNLSGDIQVPENAVARYHTLTFLLESDQVTATVDLRNIELGVEEDSGIKVRGPFPVLQNVPIGGDATLLVEPSGLPPFSFQWRKDGSILSGETNAYLLLSNMQPSNAGRYDVMVSNDGGSITSDATTLVSRSPAPLPLGAVAWWRADGNVTDSAGHHDGAILKGAGFGPGKVRQAFDFAEDKSEIEIPDAEDLRIRNKLSIEFWAKRADTDRIDIVLNKGGDWTERETNYGVGLHNKALHNMFYFYFAGGWKGTTGIADLEWHHYAVAVTNGTTEAAFYIDGIRRPQEFSGGAAAIELFPCTQPLHIGYEDQTYFGKLSLDELTIYNRVLTAEEIRAIYEADWAGKVSLTKVDPVSSPSGLVGWWRGEGDAQDVLGNNEAVLVNGTTFESGEVGQTFKLNGIDNFVQVANPVGLPLGNAPRTIELWFKATKDLLASTDSSLVQYGTEVEGKVFGLITTLNNPGKLNFMGFGRESNDLNGVTPLQENIWYHGAVTYDGTTVRLYLNGQLEASRTANLNTVLNANGLTIGYRGPNNIWSGDLDEVSIYNRALSDDEIFAIYNAGSAGKLFTAPPAALVPSGLVAWWRGEGDAKDAMGNHDGSLKGGAAFAAGEVRQSFAFDGISGFVEVPDRPDLRITDTISIEFWAQRRDLNHIDLVLNKGGDWNENGTDYGIGFHNDQYNNMFYFLFAGGWRGTPGVKDLEWHHYALVATNGSPEATFYIDGVKRPQLFAGGAGFVRLNPSTLPLVIGAQANDPAGFNYFSSLKLDELSIYNRALLDSEIQSIYQARSSGKRLNSSPNIPTIADVTLNELESLELTATASDPDAGQALSFDLVQAPEGMTIDAKTGKFSWIPSEAQGPGLYHVVVRATDDAISPLSATTSFDISVSEVNSAPYITIPDLKHAIAEELFTFQAVGTDADLPAQKLNFSLEPNAPDGADINAQTGVFAWTPLQPGNYNFGLTVSDGVVATTKLVEIVVDIPPPILFNPGLHLGVTLRGWPAQTYRIESVENAGDQNWQTRATITLTTREQLWIDPEPATNRHRVYRATQAP